MKILLHDYAGHPFQIELSRELARRGHHLIHAFFAGDPGPKGSFTEPVANLSFVGLDLPGRYDKGSLIGRRFNDVAYGRLIAGLIRRERPDLVISGNTPTEAQSALADACRETGATFLHWVQDFYSVAAGKILKKRLGMIGSLVGSYYAHLERRQLRAADGVVVITDDFRPLAEAWAGDPAKVATIENWGAMADIEPTEKANEWSRRHGLDESFNFVYSGTLGLKHNPEVLIELARRMRGRANVVTVSQGLGVPRLEAAKAAEELDNLVVLPLQPFEMLSQVLGSADVAVAVIERDASTASVPSKVQSYLCAGRPVLLAAPPENLASRVLAREEAGLVTAPDDADAILAAATRLFEEPELRRRLGENGRAFAARAYEISAVADRFEAVFDLALGRRAAAA